MRRGTWRPIAAAAIAAAVAHGCGGGDSGAGPTPPPSSSTTITITAAGASPRSLSVARGTQVTFINSDSHPHEMTSDPHPEHTDCPELNSVGNLLPTQSRQTGNLNAPRTCGFHDHQDPMNNSLKGSIVIQ